MFHILSKEDNLDFKEINKIANINLFNIKHFFLK